MMGTGTGPIMVIGQGIGGIDIMAIEIFTGANGTGPGYLKFRRHQVRDKAGQRVSQDLARKESIIRIGPQQNPEENILSVQVLIQSGCNPVLENRRRKGCRRKRSIIETGSLSRSIPGRQGVIIIKADLDRAGLLISMVQSVHEESKTGLQDRRSILIHLDAIIIKVGQDRTGLLTSMALSGRGETKMSLQDGTGMTIEGSGKKGLQ